MTNILQNRVLNKLVWLVLSMDYSVCFNYDPSDVEMC